MIAEPERRPFKRGKSPKDLERMEKANKFCGEPGPLFDVKRELLMASLVEFLEEEYEIGYEAGRAAAVEDYQREIDSHDGR